MPFWLPRSVGALSWWMDRKKRTHGIFLIVLTGVVFALLFRRIHPAFVAQLLGQIPPSVWGAAFLLTLAFPLFSALRWHLTLRVIGYTVPVRRCLTIILGTAPISAITPSKAGDLLKAVSLRGEVSALEVSGTVLAERALDVLALAGFSLAGSLWIGNRTTSRAAAAIAGVGIAGLLLLPLVVSSVRSPRVREKLERLTRTIDALRAQPLLTGRILMLTGINWLASLIQTHLLLWAVGARPPFALTVSALPMAIFVGLVPVTIGGMGTRDATLVALFAPVVSPAQALSAGILYSLFGYWLPALLGIPFLRSAFPASRGQRPNAQERPQKASREGPEYLCKICEQPVVQRHTVKDIVYYYCAACDFLQNFYWEDRGPTAKEQVATNDEARAHLWQPGDREHERHKAWEILTLMTSPLAWQSRTIHTALARTPWYRRWYQAEARRKMQRLLDFGCGHGTTVRELRDDGFDCEGLDPFAPAGAQNVRRASLEEAHLPAESFDGVFAIETMEHIPNVLATFQGIARLLRPGGVFLAQTRRLEDPGYRADQERWFYVQEPTTHVAIYSVTAMRRIAKLTGFRSVQFRGAKFARFVK